MLTNLIKMKFKKKIEYLNKLKMLNKYNQQLFTDQVDCYTLQKLQ